MVPRIVLPQAALAETALSAPRLSAGSATSLGPDCYCRSDGRFYRIGETACIRGTVAMCATVLNNTSWSISATPCPVSRMTPVSRKTPGPGRPAG